MFKIFFAIVNVLLISSLCTTLFANGNHRKRSSSAICISPENGKILQKLSVEPNAHGLAITSDAKTLYATHFYTGRVSVIDTTAFEVINTISTFAGFHVVNADN